MYPVRCISDPSLDPLSRGPLLLAYWNLRSDAPVRAEVPEIEGRAGFHDRSPTHPESLKSANAPDVTVSLASARPAEDQSGRRGTLMKRADRIDMDGGPQRSDPD
jgi:hypothetical protein